MKSKNALILAVLFIVAVGFLAISYFGFGQGRILSYHNISKGLDLSGGVSIAYDAVKSQTGEDGKIEKVEYNPTEEELNAAVATIQKRVDANGWTEAEVSKEGTKRIRVEIPGVADADQAKEQLGQTAQLNFYDESGVVSIEGYGYYISPEAVPVTEGKNVKDARAAVDQQTGAYIVSLEFNDEGKEQFYQATQNNIGKPIYIAMDNGIISAPNVNQPISGGQAQITGNFTKEEAENLASLIKSGSLPFELNVVSSSSVGATLGANSLRTSVIGGAIGIALVLLFMLVFYRMSGFAADWALVIFMGIELLALNALNITLTLPGVAGVILTVGMAVDANVIIFERIKEELNSGRTIKVAINNGFSRAFPAIFDSNITTILAGVVLYWLGSGPVKGFAQTLILGIVISMFTAIVVTRLILNGLVGIGIKNPKLYGGK